MHTYNEIRKRNPKLVISTVTVITAVMLLGTTAISNIITAESVFAYRNSQATSQINDCGNGEAPTNIGCQNTGSQIQGDKNTVALSSQQTFPSQEAPPPPETGTLEVIKEVNCPSGPDCPESGDFQIEVTGNNPIPASFGGSPLGTDVDIGIGSFSVDETVPTIPPGLGTLTTTKSADCSGTINAGETKTCTITNTITQPPPTAMVTVIKNVECVPGAQCPDLPNPSAFRMEVNPLFGDSISFPGSAEGTPVTLEPGDYSSAESLPPVPAGLQLVDISNSDDCDSSTNGPIQAGEERTCTWTNIYGPASG